MEHVTVSRGSWNDLLALLHLSTETQRAGNIRWYGVHAPQYMVAYSNEEAVAVRVMGTMLVLVPTGEGIL
jgi:hypothetical protein